MTKRIRVGVIGLGRVAQLHHLPALAESPRAELTTLCDLSQELAAYLARDYGLPPGAVATDAGDLLSRDLDGVVIANRHHGPLVRQALEAGLCVLVEKPACWTVDEGIALADLEQRTRPAVVGYMKRYDPAVRRLVESEPPAVFVRLHVFAGARHRYEKLHRRIEGHDVAAHLAGAEDQVISGLIADALGPGPAGRQREVRTMAELAIHDINLARALLGPLSVDSARRFATPYGTAFIGVLSGSGTPVSLEIVPDFQTARDWDETLTVYYPGGLTELRLGSPFRRSAPTVIYEHLASGTDIVSRKTVVSYDSAYRLELEHFLDCAADDAQSSTPIADAVADLRLVYDIVRIAEDL
jgi:predicted dehydrogenase